MLQGRTVPQETNAIVISTYKQLTIFRPMQCRHWRDVPKKGRLL